MNITTKSKYALKAVIQLARSSKGILRREDLAVGQGGISVEYLEKILLRLRAKNILKAKTGRGGGYGLVIKPEELTAWDIISAVEESPHPVSCLTSDPDACGSDCEAKALWERVWGAAVSEMKKIDIASLIQEADALQEGDTANPEKDDTAPCR